MDEHFSDSKLELYNTGQLSAEEEAKIESHCSECSHCELRVDAISADRPLILPSNFTAKQYLGAGGFAHVYLCHDSNAERLVVVKQIKPDRLSADWMKEAQNAAKIRHDNVVKIYDVLDEPPRIVMEYVDGKHLGAFLEECTPTPDMAAEIIKSIADGVDVIHQGGLIHGDLKPENILRSKEGRIVIVDFGLSADLMRFSTDNLPLGGSFAYLAPEQARSWSAGVNMASTSTEVYAIGAIFYRLLTTKPPFRGSKEELLERIPNGVSMTARAVCSAVPLQLDSICSKAMSEKIADRYKRASEIAAAIEGYQKIQWYRRIIRTSWTATALAVPSVALWLALASVFKQPPESLVRQLVTAENRLANVKEDLDESSGLELGESLDLAKSLCSTGHFEQSKSELSKLSRRMTVEIRLARVKKEIAKVESLVDRLGGMDAIETHFESIENTVERVCLFSKEPFDESSLTNESESELTADVAKVTDIIERRVCLMAFKLGLVSSYLISTRDYSFFMANCREYIPEISEHFALLNLNPALVVDIRVATRSSGASLDDYMKVLCNAPGNAINARWGHRALACFSLAWHLTAMAHHDNDQQIDAAQIILGDGQIEAAAMKSNVSEQLSQFVSQKLSKEHDEPFASKQFLEYLVEITESDF